MMSQYIVVFSSVVMSILLLSGCAKKDAIPYESEIYLVRHFEKEAQTDATGKDVSLNAAGQLNAVLLAEHLTNKNIKGFYSTDYNRTMQSIAPSSEAFGAAVSTYNPSLLDDFAVQLLKSKHNQLVVGHSNTTGVLFGLLGCDAFIMSEKDYGDILLVKRRHSADETTISACVTYKLVNNKREDSARSSRQKSYDISALTFVPQSDLDKYWLQTNAKFIFDSAHSNSAQPDLSMNSEKSPKQNGIVELGFIIDQNGHTSNFEILKSEPPYLWDTQALYAAKQLTFTATELSTEKAKPIYTTWLFTFKSL